ncbi:putative transcription factor SOX-14 [Trichonephila clavata]|uniref:Putative transcription factor SOX-14 n=1 Tax=Trichonephila clavata TaxID=2740835 RepID=A0A8X6J907_TRICU|nr:putative transcription factor SOX-14 [Trichonephila clavata]
MEGDRVLISDNDASSSNFGSLSVQSNSSTPYTDAVNCKKKIMSHIKRPMNPFMVWSQMARKKIIERQPNVHNAEISIQLGMKWKTLTLEERKPYIEEAARLRELHIQEYPDYKYKPKKRQKTSTPGSKKKLTLNRFSSSNHSSPNSSASISTVSSTVSNTHSPSLNSDEYLGNLNSDSSSPFKNLEILLLSDSKTSKPTASGSSSHSMSPNISKDVQVSLHVPQAEKNHTNELLKIGNTENLDIAKDNSNVSNQSRNSFSPSLFENKITIDKKFRENLKGTKITLLEEVGGNCPVSTESVNSSSDKSGPKKGPNILQIDGSYTSGYICAVANASKDEWSETFDYLADNVLHNSNDAVKEIKELAQEYRALKEKCDNPDFEFDLPEYKIPSLSEVLGENWLSTEDRFNMDF